MIDMKGIKGHWSRPAQVKVNPMKMEDLALAIDRLEQNISWLKQHLAAEQVELEGKEKRLRNLMVSC